MFNDIKSKPTQPRQNKVTHSISKLTRPKFSVNLSEKENKQELMNRSNTKASNSSLNSKPQKNLKGFFRGYETQILSKRLGSIQGFPRTNEYICKENNQWHKKSVSMKMKVVPFLQNRKPIKGFLVKFKKGNEIYAFRCLKDNTLTNNENQKIEISQDNDIPTDDEQLFIALCTSMQDEILSDIVDDEHNEKLTVQTQS